MLTVLLGGARRGKSSVAVERGRRHPGPVTHVATSPHIDGDHDLAGRIATHRDERPPGWSTIEEESTSPVRSQPAATTSRSSTA